jgi:hypothetical protein
LCRTDPSGPLPGCHTPCSHALAGGAASRHWLDGHRTSPPTPRRTPAMPRPMPCRGVDRFVAHHLHLCPTIKAPSSPLLARDTEPHHGHHCRRRRAPCSSRVCCHLSMPRASPHTQRACTPACWPGRPVCSPEPEFPWPPPGGHRELASPPVLQAWRPSQHLP